MIVVLHRRTDPDVAIPRKVERFDAGKNRDRIEEPHLIDPLLSDTAIDDNHPAERLVFPQCCQARDDVLSGLGKNDYGVGHLVVFGGPTVVGALKLFAQQNNQTALTGLAPMIPLGKDQQEHRSTQRQAPHYQSRRNEITDAYC